MALHIYSYTAIEGTNGNYEPVRGGSFGSSYRTFDSGSLAESPVEPQILDPDRTEYFDCHGLYEVVKGLDKVDRACEDMLKKFRLGEGPLTSQSDVSQCSTENTALKNCSTVVGSTEKNRQKFVPPAKNVVIDLSSDDSSESGASTRLDQEPPEEAGQVVQSPLSPLATSVATGVTGICSPPVSPPISSLKRQYPDSANGGSPAVNKPIVVTLLSDSDDDDDEKRSRFESSANDKAAEVEGVDKEDPAGLLKRMADLKKGGLLEPSLQTPGNATAELPPYATAELPPSKRRKSTTGDDLLHNVGNVLPPVQSSPQQVHEPVQMGIVTRLNMDFDDGLRSVQESPVLDIPKRGRGRPRKDPSSSQVQLHGNGHTQGRSGKSGNRDEFGEVQRDNKGKGKGKERTKEAEELLEDEHDEEEECRKAAVPDTTEELRKLSAKLNGEKVNYEPYVRKIYEEEEDELDDVFNELKTVVATTSGLAKMNLTKSSEDGNEVCDHKNFDFDEDLGYFCGDCGSVGIEMPTSDSNQQNKSCQHKNYDFTDEEGVYCPDCGKVWRDIESIYVQSEITKGARKQAQRAQEEPPEPTKVQLSLDGGSGIDDFRGADLELHPYFVEKLLPHQKKGFKFLTENLLGRSQESIGCVLAHAPGTGKTCLVISFIQSFLSRYPEGKPLILAPKIMLQSWESEFNHWKVQEVPIHRIGGTARDSTPIDGGYEDDDEDEDTRLASSVKVTVKEGRALQLREWQKGRAVLLMSYKLFANMVTNGMGDRVSLDSLDYQMSKALLESTNLVILDEGHLARNGNTQITRALQAMETRRRVLLSGTLFQNNFKELYTLLKLCRDDFMLLNPHYGKRIHDQAASIHGPKYGSDLSSLDRKELMHIEERIFTEEIGERLENYVKDGETRTDKIESVVTKLQSLTSSFVDWYPGEILKSLPGLIEYSIHLNLTEYQQRTLQNLPNSDQLKHHMTRQYMEVAACIHPSLVHRREEAYLQFSEPNANSLQNEAHKGVKITFILRLMAFCSLQKEKLLIFCSTLDPLAYIEDLFGKAWDWRQGREILRLDGAMLESDRQRVIKSFNKSSQSQVLLASTRACKEGITLVGASRVVILDNLDNPSVIRQAVSRAFRMGQEKKVFVYRLVATHRSEEQVFRRTVSKERLSQVLLDPVSTMAKFGSFLKEQSASEVEDNLLKKLMITDREEGRQINVVHRYNAAG